ncbi:hypothetical protein DPMN_047080 [Dreissena polymorpha]|uniref:Uncharacterized protein n=1 Tax=Dreissena polymorpha TaxID=45954 RepID=A0A9D4D970_DREPO|nr:hypothetical protein DPMN_047080 [Dreissena polymorpha]
MYRSYTGTLPAFTGTPQGHQGRCQSSAGVYMEAFNILILFRWSPGCPRSSPVHLGRPRFIPVESRFIPVDPASRTGAPPAS